MECNIFSFSHFYSQNETHVYECVFAQEEGEERWCPFQNFTCGVLPPTMCPDLPAYKSFECLQVTCSLTSSTLTTARNMDQNLADMMTSKTAPILTPASMMTSETPPISTTARMITSETPLISTPAKLMTSETPPTLIPADLTTTNQQLNFKLADMMTTQTTLDKKLPDAPEE